MPRCHLFAIVLLAAAAAAQTAQFTQYGTGCYRQRASFYEMFPANVFDLAGTTASPGGFSLINLGTGFVAIQPFTGWHTPGPAAVSLLLGDDTVSLPQPLGFSMPYPGGIATQISVCSNGFVYLNGGTNASFVPSASGLLTNSTMIAARWTDLNPAGGPGITWESDPVAGVAWLTFLGIQQFGGTAQSTFQMAFHSYGQIDCLYGPCQSTQAVLVGWSPGVGALDPGAMDISAALPFQTGPDADPLSLSSSARPRIGTTMPLVASGMPVGTQGAIFVVGAVQHAAGLDLSSIGMGGCRQYASIDSYAVVPGAGPSATLQVAIPNNATLLGQTAFVQAVASAPFANSLQLITSNGAALLVGSL